MFHDMHIGDHASTYGGNPLACAAGLAVAAAFRDSKLDLLGNVLARGEQLRGRARALMQKSPVEKIRAKVKKI